MIITTIDKIKKIAIKVNSQNKSWHFHLLTPNCLLNKTKKHAFILENATDSKVYVAYSNKPHMKAGKQLVKLLHKGVLKEKSKIKKQTAISPQAEKILKRAKTLNQQGKYWHHHMLFPDCIFNQTKKWLIMFEDTEKKEILKVKSDQEPTNDLKQIEKLYYQQKKIS